MHVHFRILTLLRLIADDRSLPKEKSFIHFVHIEFKVIDANRYVHELNFYETVGDRDKGPSISLGIVYMTKKKGFVGYRT